MWGKWSYLQEKERPLFSVYDAFSNTKLLLSWDGQMCCLKQTKAPSIHRKRFAVPLYRQDVVLSIWPAGLSWSLTVTSGWDTLPSSGENRDERQAWRTLILSAINTWKTRKKEKEKRKVNTYFDLRLKKLLLTTGLLTNVLHTKVLHVFFVVYFFHQVTREAHLFVFCFFKIKSYVDMYPRHTI